MLTVFLFLRCLFFFAGSSVPAVADVTGTAVTGTADVTGMADDVVCKVLFYNNMTCI